MAMVKSSLGIKPCEKWKGGWKCGCHYCRAYAWAYEDASAAPEIITEGAAGSTPGVKIVLEGIDAAPEAPL